jgi:hypothetical protein
MTVIRSGRGAKVRRRSVVRPLVPTDELRFDDPAAEALRRAIIDRAGLTLRIRVNDSVLRTPRLGPPPGDLRAKPDRGRPGAAPGWTDRPPARTDPSRGEICVTSAAITVVNGRSGRRTASPMGTPAAVFRLTSRPAQSHHQTGWRGPRTDPAGQGRVEQVDDDVREPTEVSALDAPPPGSGMGPGVEGRVRAVARHRSGGRAQRVRRGTWRSRGGGSAR